MAKKQKVKSVSSPYKDLILDCVGMKYRMSKPELEQVAEVVSYEYGITCTLSPEPENEVDKSAIRVLGADKRNLFTGKHLGYVARPANEPLLELLNRGAEIKTCFLEDVDADRGEGVLAIRIKVPPK
jgi:hypothetical protein